VLGLGEARAPSQIVGAHQDPRDSGPARVAG
jgi:hypothetical protein